MEHIPAVVVSSLESSLEGRGKNASSEQALGSFKLGIEPALCISSDRELADFCGQTIARIHEAGIPVVSILVSGRPLGIGPELEYSSAFVAAWLPGSEGQGIADVLFGDFDFEGRLSFSWPRDPLHQQNVGDSDYDPLFPYGYGLSFKQAPARSTLG